MMVSATRRMSDNRLERAIGDLMQVKQCLRCSSLFTEMDGVGAWTCRMHPGTYQPVEAGTYGTALDTFSCCGASPVPGHRQYRGRDMASGCTRCDHTIRSGIPGPLAIPTDRAMVLFGERLGRNRRPGVRVDPGAGMVHIARTELVPGPR